MNANVKTQKPVKVSKLIKTDVEAQNILNSILETKKQAPKVKTASAYKIDVLAVNAEIKTERATFASALKVLNVLLPDSAPAYIKTDVKNALKDSAKFNALRDITRKSKSGKVSPFFILQAIYKANKK